MSAATFLNSNLIADIEESPNNHADIVQSITQILESNKISKRCKPSMQRALAGIIDATS
jgi:hypothetical protein